MFFLPVGVVSLLSGFGLFVYTQSQGGMDAAVKLSDQVFTGAMLLGVAGLLVVAGVAFIVSAILSAVRRIAALVAVAALVGGGGLGAFAPSSLSQYQADHGCKQLSNVKIALPGCTTTTTKK